MVRRFALPEPVSEELASALGAAFRNPGVLATVVDEITAREAELQNTLDRQARLALKDTDVRPVALQTEGALMEVQRLKEIILRWTE